MRYDFFAGFKEITDEQALNKFASELFQRPGKYCTDAKDLNYLHEQLEKKGIYIDIAPRTLNTKKIELYANIDPNKAARNLYLSGNGPFAVANYIPIFTMETEEPPSKAVVMALHRLVYAAHMLKGLTKAVGLWESRNTGA